MKTINQVFHRRNRGSFIVEAAIGYGVMMLVALLMLKASRTVTATQQWTVMQGLTDAFLTQETAIGNRIPFDDMTAAASLWPVYPTMATSTVIIGRLPGGTPVTATLQRTRHADDNNLSENGGNGTAVSNPAGMEAWQLQSFLVYRIGTRDYVKSRTMLRIR
ncbi:MAG: hypothetical protein KDN20_11205 [Verrucomicrobiae bacterium]|nr:hypothetical protein [Verrucomicrobiae bacterium]